MIAQAPISFTLPSKLSSCSQAIWGHWVEAEEVRTNGRVVHHHEPTGKDKLHHFISLISQTPQIQSKRTRVKMMPWVEAFETRNWWGIIDSRRCQEVSMRARSWPWLMPWTNLLGSNGLTTAIWDRLAFRSPRQLCSWCMDAHTLRVQWPRMSESELSSDGRPRCIFEGTMRAKLWLERVNPSGFNYLRLASEGNLRI